MAVITWPFSLLYGIALWFRSLLFASGIFRSKKVKAKVISVGNISVGGSGKSPWVIYLAEKLKDRNYRVGIVSRGYKGEFEGVLKLSEATTAKESGDEPLMIFKRTGCPVYVCADRYKAALQLCEDHSVDVVIMDDGFQHRWLYRDMDVVIMDASWPLWKYSLLPLGRLRESVSSLRRASLCVLNKWNLSTDKQRTFVLNLLREQKHSEDSIVKSQYVLKGCNAVFSGQNSQPQLDKAFLLCAIAVPESFVKVVKQHQIFPVDTLFYPDHHNWNEDELQEVFKKMKARGCRDLIVTEKDKVKLLAYENIFKAAKIDLWVFEIELKILEMENLFVDSVVGRLGLSNG